MGIGKNRSVRVGVAGLAVAATAVLTMPAVASAVPEESTPGTTTPGTTTPGTTTPGTTAPDSATTLPEIPGDAELADLVRRLKAEGGAEKAMEALTAILSSSGQLDPSKYLDSSTLLQSMGLDKLGLEQLGITLPGLSTTPEAPGTTTPGTTTPSTTTPGTTPNATTPGTSTPESSAPNATTPTTDAPANPLAPNPVDAPVTPSAVTPSAVTPAVADALAALQKITGTTLLSPALSPLCATPTADNPLGLVTAPAVAVPGPWPTVKTNNNVDMLRGLADLLPADNDLLTAIDDDQTAFALVPPGEPGADKFRVAWFNTSTLKGGMADLKPLSEVAASSPLKQLLTATESFHGIRLARVQTGKGTILSAVFGTTTKAGRTCFFLPALGTVNNQ